MRIDIMGEIWDSSWELEAMSLSLQNADGEEVEVHIASNGGSVTQGNSIAGLLSSYDGPTVAYIHGMCASIATLIAVSCKRVVMSNVGFFMIHNSYMGWAEGGGDKLEQDANTLKKIDQALLAAYKKKVLASGKWGGSDEELEEEIRMMMNQETWLTPEEALDFGLIDEVKEDAEAEAKASLIGKRLLAKAKPKREKMEKKKKNFFDRLYAAFMATDKEDASDDAEQATDNESADEADSTVAEDAADNTEESTEEAGVPEQIAQQLAELQERLAAAEAQNTALEAKLTSSQQKAAAKKAPYAGKSKAGSKKEKGLTAKELHQNNYIKNVYG